MKALLLIPVASLCICSAVSAQAFWTDSFQSFLPGSLRPNCPNIPPSPNGANSGGWRGWDNDPVAAGVVSTAFGRLSTQSLLINNNPYVDAIQPFNYNYTTYPTTGAWTFQAWQYLPSASWAPPPTSPPTPIGKQMLVLLNSYLDGSWQTASVPGPPSWAVQLVMDADTTPPCIYDYGRGGTQVALVFDTWKLIEIKVDLDHDTVSVTYDGILVSKGKYVQDVAVDGGGPREIACLELWGADSIADAYYDDFSLAPTPDIYQRNSNGSYLSINGGVSNGQTPVKATLRPGQSYAVNFNSLNLISAPQPYDVGISTQPLLWGGPTGIAYMTLGGQILSLNIWGPPFPFFINGLTFTTPFPTPWGPNLTFTAGAAPSDTYAQMINIDPTNVDTVALSAPIEVHVRNTSTVVGPTANNGWRKIVLADQPGAPPFIIFAGATYGEFYVNSNGTLSFGGPDNLFPYTPTPTRFQNGPPRFGVWSDMDSRFSGSIATTFNNGIIRTTFSGLPEQGGYASILASLPTATTAGSWDLVIFPPVTPTTPTPPVGPQGMNTAGSGGCYVMSYAPNPLYTQTSIVGLSPGTPLPATGGLVGFDPGGAPLSVITPLPQTLNGVPGTHMIYEHTMNGLPIPSTVPPLGFVGIWWPIADGSSYTLF